MRCYAKAEDYYWFTLYGALDHLEHGVTGAYDFDLRRHFVGPSCARTDCDEASFRARWIPAFASCMAMTPTYRPEDTPAMARARLKSFLDWTAAQPKVVAIPERDAERQRPHSTRPYQQAVSEKSMMDEFHIGNQSHYLEPPDTVAAEQVEIHWFEDSGLSALHSTSVTSSIPTISSSTKAAAACSGMSWNPLSNGRLASGVADIPKYLKRAFAWAWAWTAKPAPTSPIPSKTCARAYTPSATSMRDATIMSPYQVLYLHTMGSADVMGVKDKLGSLEPGKFADFVVIDPTRFGTVFDAYASLVLVTAERDIDRVYVGGELMVEQGRAVHQDMGKILGEVNRRSQATTVHAQ